MKKSKQYDLSIVIPALREARRIGKTLTELSNYLDTLPLNVEVILVAADGGDETVDVALQYAKKINNFRVLQPGKPVGKGRDVKYGMLRAQGSAVMFMDADLATPLVYISDFYLKYERGADVVIGIRDLKKHHKNSLRRGVSMLGNMAFRVLGGMWVEDSQCGFKLFSGKANKICFEKLTIQKWGFDMEVLAIAKQHRFEIVSVRVDDWTHMEDGVFEQNTIKNMIASMSDLFRIFVNRVQRKYRQ